MQAVPVDGGADAPEAVDGELLAAEAAEQGAEDAPAEPQATGPSIGFEVSAERNQCVDWLHSGSREPLASMGMYVYCMYVSVYVCAVRLGECVHRCICLCGCLSFCSYGLEQWGTSTTC
mgnify:CR=1 FL=1